MNPIESVIAFVSPGRALARARDRAALQIITARYDAATSTNRGKSWRPNGNDADAAAAQRSKLSFVARDMVRNTAFATRAQQVIANNVVGNGIIPKVVIKSKSQHEKILAVIEAHFDSTDIDANGLMNLYGLQRLAINTIVESGEVLIRRRRRNRTDGFTVPFQIEVLEPDFLADIKDGPNGQDRNQIRDGIEYNQIGQRVAYWLYYEHPGASRRLGVGLNREVRRVPASEILHIFDPKRPGQMRGVSWFAPVAMLLQDQADYQDAQLMRQKIAACFTAFRRMPEGDTIEKAEARSAASMVPGRIETLLPGEEITFGTPPGVDGADEFTRGVLRAVSAGMGITYESMTGDLSQVSFASGRLGRSEMNRNVSCWQWLMMVPQFLQPLAAWTIEAYEITYGKLPKGSKIEWVPPAREVVDITREVAANIKKVEAGLASRSSLIRADGEDPERVNAEIEADQIEADSRRLIFSTDRRPVAPVVLKEPKAAPVLDEAGQNPAKA